MSLKQIMTQLADMEAEASVNLDEVDPRVRVGAEGRWRAAQASIGQLRAQYMQEVVKSVFVIAVGGPNAEQFAEIARNSFDTIALDYQFLTKLLTRRLKARRCADVYGQNEHWMLLTELNQIKGEYDVVSLPAPVFTALSTYYQQEIQTAVDILLRETYQSRLNSIVLRREIASEALKKRFDGSKLPVIIYNYDQPLESGLDESLLPQPVTLIDTTGEVTEASVKAELIKVRDRVLGVPSVAASAPSKPKRKRSPKPDTEQTQAHETAPVTTEATPAETAQENEDAGE